MPRVTIYIKEADVPLWDEARRIAPDGNLSEFLASLLRCSIQVEAPAVGKSRVRF